jgi:hypothetical protein
MNRRFATALTRTVSPVAVDGSGCVLAIGLALALAACTVARADDDRTVRGKAGFQTLYQVLLHPRCMNCHPSGDAPLQYDDSRPHGMNISRRSEANGVACATCHRDKNGTRPGQPPGAPSWHLPPSDTPMIFQGRTPHQLCEQLKDPRQTGHRDLARLIDHVAHDELVGWGWAPGPGRAPVPIPRAEVIAAMQTWANAGAPCPD